MNRSAIENRVQLSGSVNLANPINSKIALSKKLNGGRNLINTGTNIIENTLKNQIKVVERIPSNISMIFLELIYNFAKLSINKNIYSLMNLFETNKTF